MGDRYFVSVICPKCGKVDDNVYYAPTCGFTDHECSCGEITDLEKYTGISEEEASNVDAIRAALKSAGKGK